MSEIMIEDGLVESAQEINEIPEQNEEYLKLISDLNLEGQVDLLTSLNKNISVMPFRAMSTEEFRIYQEVLPSRVSVFDFKREIIPLRVLTLISFAKEHFKRIEVWYDENGTDPLVVGKDNEYSNNGWFIARWGRELQSLKELKERAIERMIPKVVKRCKEEISDYQIILNDPRTTAELKLQGEWVKAI